MSDSDDTDVLLLIPPDLFVVPSSSSSSDEEDSHCRVRRKYRKNGVVTEILEHVQSLESRISAIEYREDSLEVSLLNASLDSQTRAISSHPIVEFSPSTRFQPTHILSRLSSLPGTPAKPLFCSSSKSSPGCLGTSVAVSNATRSNEGRVFGRSETSYVTDRTNACSWRREEKDSLYIEDLTKQDSRGAKEIAGIIDGTYGVCPAEEPAVPAKNSISESFADDCKSKLRREKNCPVGDMELSEVDELLQEMEATEMELARRIDNSNARRCSEERERLRNSEDYSGATVANDRSQRETKFAAKSPMRRLDFQFVDEEFQRPFASLNFPRENREIPIHADISLPEDDITRLNDASSATRISDYKMWERNVENSGREKLDGNGRNDEKNENSIVENDSTSVNLEKIVEKRNNNRRTNNSCKFPEYRASRNSEIFIGEIQTSRANGSTVRSLPNLKNSNVTNCPPTDNGNARIFGCNDDGTNDTTDNGFQGTRQSQCTDELQQTIREIRATGNQRTNSPLAKNTEACPRKTQRLFALSDFWDCDGTKSQEEMLRIRLEEEKFRREHCEHLIQELQKRLLEQQEKVAVAIRVDNEKNTAISQFQNAWSKLRQRWETLERDHSELVGTLKNLTEKHDSELTEYQQQIKRNEGELSKALDLAGGYKEKSDSLVKEKLEMLKSHADELEKYKSLVQEAEQRHENLRDERNKCLERNRQLEDIVNNAQQDLNKERLRSSEVRTEMGVIHKALDACEAELTILRQEKENLQLRIKEELTRNGILEQNKNALVEATNEAKNAEKAAKEETRLLVNRQEQIRSELREIYQNQLDDVVKTKLKEFQEQLDAAEMAFQADLETRQRAIAECAARKIKSIIDKHQLEINLLEEKHIEEKRLGEIQLAQASQKAIMLEVQLNSQRAGKTHLAEQLHSVMQKQWQQALQIISGGQMENLSPLQRLNAERIFEARTSKRCNSACCNKDHRSARPELRSSSTQNLHHANFRQEQDESLVTLTSNDDTPLTRKESKDDLRKYIKMILDMQQQPNKDEFARAKCIEESNSSPPPVTREVPRKHYTKREPNGLSEESVTWQRVDEQSNHDTSEYMQIPQSQGSKADQQRNKPPWK